MSARRAGEIAVATATFALVVFAIAAQSLERAEGPVAARLADDLGTLRRAVAIYRAEHGGLLPGTRDSRDPARDSSAPAIDFEKQLTSYSDALGRTSESPSARFRFGPYLRDGRMPVNASNGERRIACDSAAAPPAGFRFDRTTGRVTALGRDGRPLGL